MPQDHHPPDGAPANLPEQERLLASLGLFEETIRHARIMARLNGTAIEDELIAGGHITVEALYQRMADALGLAFLPVLPARLVVDHPELDQLLGAPRALRLTLKDQPPITVLAPRLERLADLKQRIESDPAMANRTLITTPAAIRIAVWKAGADRRVSALTSRLGAEWPEFSARLILFSGQAFLLGFLAAVLAILLVTRTGPMLALVHALLSLVYAGTVLIRLLALLSPGLKQVPEKIDRLQPGLPVYSVLVALHHEAAVARQLVAALSRLDWPASRLDIKLICEADDRETIEALIATGLPPQMEIIEVPNHPPRTKPKALAYALAGARGALVTIYDAEDRPHPMQLREAHARFLREGPELACLQAPLEISNAGKSWVASLFAVEYACQFHALLPWLARRRMPVPLGGTSNHFRLSALIESGAWDPYNVTEDADLGTRLHRLGYRTGTITCPTREDAPEALPVWMAQRRRWFKGWLQTLLVSCRYPLRLLNELGMPGTLAFLLTTGGMLVSALFHPLLYLSLILLAKDALTGQLPDLQSPMAALMGLDLFNLVGGFALLLLARHRVMPKHLPGAPLNHLLRIPAYWLNLSAAAWMALDELHRKPFHWNKTPHSPHRPEKPKPP